MNKLAKALLAILLLIGWVSPSLAQNASFGITPTGTTQSMSVTSASSTVTLSATFGGTILIQNVGTKTAYLKGGTSSVTATTSDFPIQPGWGIVFNYPAGTTLAAITGGSDTTSLLVSKGMGSTSITGGLSGGGVVPNSGDIIVTPTNNFTRPGNTTAYVVGYLVANSTTAGSVVPLSWTATRVNAGNGYIRRTRLSLSSKSITNTTFRVHYYTVTPTIANGDGAAWSTTVANLMCDMDVTVTDVGSDVSMGWGTPNQGSECNFVAAGGTQTIYALIEARAAYTPASAEVITVIPEIHQN